jgi:hypothetical protein
MLNKSQYTRECLLKHPLLISKLLKDKSFNPKITKGILYGMIPFRSSVEIECIKSLGQTFVHKYTNNRGNELFTKLKEKYDLYDYNDDFTYDKKSLCEHRISIINYSQAAGLYKVLEDMKKYCKLNMSSGIHIHIDAHKISNHNFLSTGDNLRKVERFLASNLDTLEEIFGKYEGEYNEKYVHFDERRSWINVQYREFGSIEFRIAPMTFDYETIIMWIIKCNKIIKELYKEFRISY